MNFYVDIVVCTLAILYLVLHGANSRWRALAAFGVIFGLLFVAGQPIWLSLLLSILGSHLVQMPRHTHCSVGTEGFENPTGSALGSTRATGDADDDADKKDDDDDDDDDGDGGDDREEGVDMFRTMLESYKSLTPDQVEHMTSDTKELIETQKSLLETVKSLAPVVTQGKEMLDTFKDYFGKDTKDILGAALKGTGLGSKKKKKSK